MSEQTALWWYKHQVKIDELSVYMCSGCNRTRGGNGDSMISQGWNRHDRVAVDKHGPEGAWCVGTWKKVEITDAHKTALILGGPGALHEMITGGKKVLSLPQPYKVTIPRYERPDLWTGAAGDLLLAYGLRDDGLWEPVVTADMPYLAISGKSKKGGFPVASYPGPLFGVPRARKGAEWAEAMCWYATSLTSMRFGCSNGHHFGTDPR